MGIPEGGVVMPLYTRFTDVITSFSGVTFVLFFFVLVFLLLH